MDKDPSFQFGSSEFSFPNGDKYEGEFCAHRSGMAWRQGHGIYLTHDGQTYEGEWKDDKLDETKNIQITYANEDQFCGRISKHKYNGPGAYTFHTENHLVANFAANKPVGDVTLVDYKGNCWYGTAGGDRTILFQEHPFYADLDYERGKGTPKYPQLADSRTSTELQPLSAAPEFSITSSQLEKRVFGKSQKIGTDMDFTDSDWYNDYQNYKKMHKLVFGNIAQLGMQSLSSEEKDWYAKYLKSKEILKKRQKVEECDTSPRLLELYFSDEFKKSCPPIRVMYPTDNTQLGAASNSNLPSDTEA